MKDLAGFIWFFLVILLHIPLILAFGLYWLVSKKLLKSNKNERLAVNVLYGIDQWANTLLGGHPDETISSRLGRTINRKVRYWWVRFLQRSVDYIAKTLFNDVNHCLNAIDKYEQLKFKEDRKEVWNWIKG